MNEILIFNIQLVILLKTIYINFESFFSIYTSKDILNIRFHWYKQG